MSNGGALWTVGELLSKGKKRIAALQQLLITYVTTLRYSTYSAKNSN